MNVENYIETQYREIDVYDYNPEFESLYINIKHPKLKKIFTILHFELIASFRKMNERLPTNGYTAHFWAEPSRQLIHQIDISLNMLNTLKNTPYSIEIDKYYYELFLKCRDFLRTSGGSELPINMEKVDLFYIDPIFKMSSGIVVDNTGSKKTYDLKQIGYGSYATVHKYKDDFYNKTFVLKKANKGLNQKELQRFKREFEEMKEFSSPYVLEVYRFDEEENQYIMEYMDYTLEKYIEKNNNKITIPQRKRIVQQILRAFEYIHSKDRLHRDISPRNILIKEYEDVVVVKISDFGLVKTPDSQLTTINTEFKGYFNDPSLIVEGFDNYNILHEVFALTRVVYFVMTGRSNTDNIKDEKLRYFIQKGLNSDKSKRFQNVSEMIEEFKKI